ncbi:MAG TPA: ABC transporter permease [Gemmatimonadaceae bacterium]|jgi:predicted permease|nr:ABC transporter permease [Gemmatimonadaceae bacterium]
MTESKERWFRALTLVRRSAGRDVDDELRFHVESRVADLVASGVDPATARARAEAEFGDQRTIREQTVRIDERIRRRRRLGDWLNEIWRDVVVGLRSLRRTPGVAISALLCSALGIGATGAITSAAYAILVRALPYADADHLVAVYSENPGRAYHRVNVSWPDYETWRDGTRAFSALGMWTWTTLTFSGEGGEAERIEGAEMTPNLVTILGVAPELGHGFVPTDTMPGAPPVALISHGLWQRRYGGDSTIVGRRVEIGSQMTTIVGVMPPRFNFPDRGDAWIPFKPRPGAEAHGNRGYAGAIGRLRPNVTIDQARSDMYRIDAAMVRDFPNENEGWRSEILPLRDDLVGDLKRPVQIFLAAVMMVLLIVCANVANLLLARGAARSGEIAVRTALGASRQRLARQLMTESFALAIVAGAFGVMIAWWGVRLLRYAFPGQTPPSYISLTVDGASLAFIAGITLLTGVLFGILPAVRGTRVDLGTVLRGVGRGSDGHQSRVRGSLVVLEIALTVVLTVGAMLLLRSYKNFEGTALGFDEQGILSARIALAKPDYPTSAQRIEFYDRLLARLRALPGVTFAASAQGIPFSGWNLQAWARIEGMPPRKRGEELDAHYQYVSSDYFKAIGVGLVRGRWLTPQDRDSLHPPVLVNEQMVKVGFGGADPIGKHVLIGGDRDPVATVVGVVRDFRHYRLPEPMGPAVYYAYAAYPTLGQTIVLRTGSRDPHALIPELRRVVRELDPRVALSEVQTFDEVVGRSLWRQRLHGAVLSIFAVLSLVLACIGLYGVLSYAVTQRTRELGVRIALGANTGDVVRLVLRQSGALVVGGVAVGLIGALFASRLLETLLYGVGPADLLTFTTVPLGLAAVALLASAIPARRAAEVDPIAAIRAE